MARAAKVTQPQSKLSSKVHRALREGALYVFGALAMILWVALFTYDQADPGFFQTTTDGAVRNEMGKVGAYVADALFTIFGRPAYLFTFMVFYLGWMLYREEKTQIELTRLDFGLRMSGFVATLVTSCALATLHFSSAGFRDSAGGYVGLAVGVWLNDVLKLLGAIRKRLLAEAHAPEAHKPLFEKIVHSDILAWIREGRLTEVNRLLAEVLGEGWSAEELLAKEDY